MITYNVCTNLEYCAVEVSKKEFEHFLFCLNRWDPSYFFRTENEVVGEFETIYKKYFLSTGELAAFIIESEDLI